MVLLTILARRRRCGRIYRTLSSFWKTSAALETASQQYSDWKKWAPRRWSKYARCLNETETETWRRVNCLWHSRYWTSPLVQIFVCIRRVGRLSFDFCSPPITSGDPGPAFVTIPGPLFDPFEVVLEARNFAYRNGPFQGGFAIIDDIEYIASLCGSRGHAREPFTTRGVFKEVSKVGIR